jgi:uncharacterized membrane protein
VEIDTIKKAGRILLGANLIFAGVSHLTFARKAFRAQVPEWVPVEKDDTVLYSGFAEIALGTALVFTPKKHEATVGKLPRLSLQVFSRAISPNTPIKEAPLV